MKICACICEYNPFHTGHLYQINQIKKRCDKVFCLMSGNFVQRAEPAIIDKYLRAKIALDAGADFVVELPLLYAISNGEKFANGSINIIKKYPFITHIAFGVEHDKPDIIKKIADIQCEESEDFKEILKTKLDEGFSYPHALTYTTCKIGETQKLDSDEIKEILSLPNNLLGIEYLKAIRKNNLNIKPILIKRQGSNYNAFNITGDYASASFIRERIEKDDLSSVMPYIYDEILFPEVRAHKVNKDLFNQFLLLSLRTHSIQELANLYDVKEGLEYKLKENAEKYITIDDVIQNTKSKRYTYARIKRICLQSLLNIGKKEYDFIPPRLLAIKNFAKEFLPQMVENTIIKNTDYDKFSQYNDIFEIEKRASNIYSLLTQKENNQFYCNKIVTDKLQSFS